MSVKHHRELEWLGAMWLAVVSVLWAGAGHADDEPRRVALLVGVNVYEKRLFDDLRWAENDVIEMGEALRGLGFDKVVVMTGSATGDLRANKQNIETQIELLLRGVKKSDIVLVMLSGHGQQLRVTKPGGVPVLDNFYCPVDAVANMPETMISLTWLTDEKLNAQGGQNLLLVDACRDETIVDPDRGVRSRGVQGKVVSLPEGTVILFSCAAGQKSIERDSLKIVPIPAGEFWMGTSPEQVEQILRIWPETKREFLTNEQPRHRVRITKLEGLSAHEVTIGQFRRFVEDDGYKTEAERDGKGGNGIDVTDGQFKQDAKYTWRSTGFDQTDDHPVVNVSWNDANAFCQWLTRKDGKTYRLPTEAEWEYACRAGSDGLFTNGDDPENLARIGNVADARVKERFPNSKTIGADDGYLFTAPVGRYAANAWGLHDMHGNVWEWCLDGYDAAYYKDSSPADPRGSSTASLRDIRGGSWGNDPRFCRPACRSGDEPGIRNDYLGFRLARVPSGG
jgi:sulfatase modifying factor 1